MKNSILFYLFISFTLLLSACSKDEETAAEGTIAVKLRVWNNSESSSAVTDLRSFSNAIELPFKDILGYKYEMKATTDEIQDGMNPSDANWITIYTSQAEMRDSERDFQFELPPGEYKGFSLLQGKDFYWVADYNGTDIEIPVSNSGSGDRILNVFGENGLYSLDENGLLSKANNDEDIGTSFIVENGKTTTVIVRINFTAINWYDHDENGIWSTGDEAGDPMLPVGVTTMADFIVEYQ